MENKLVKVDNRRRSFMIALTENLSVNCGAILFYWTFLEIKARIGHYKTGELSRDKCVYLQKRAFSRPS